MHAQLLFVIFLSYSALLILLGLLVSRRSSNEVFFSAGKTSPWFVVSYGMIGASLSGITFLSVPGNVAHSNFSYMVMVFGYFFGYLAIAYILLPLYYRLNVTSIYSYLGERFGFYSHKTGSAFFLLSRVIGASFRMYIVVSILQIFIFDTWGIPFWLTVIIFVLLIWAYTNKGGIKTVVWTDTLQTTFMLAAVVVTIVLIGRIMHRSLPELWTMMRAGGYTKMFYFTEWKDAKYFLKMFFSGAFIALAMTGLDQDMMQKNLTIKSLRDAQKNILSLGAFLIPINFVFLFLGGVLYVYADAQHFPLPSDSDQVFSAIAMHLGLIPEVIFFIGLIAAAYSSADSALTALTTSFSIDILDIPHSGKSEKEQEKIRKRVHIAISIVIVLVIIIFNTIKDEAIITSLFKIAGYTYGPLLGLYSFGLVSKWKVRDRYVPYIAILSPLLTYGIKIWGEHFVEGFHFGFELLIVNALITFLALFLFRIE